MKNSRGIVLVAIAKGRRLHRVDDFNWRDALWDSGFAGCSSILSDFTTTCSIKKSDPYFISTKRAMELMLEEAEDE